MSRSPRCMTSRGVRPSCVTTRVDARPRRQYTTSSMTTSEPTQSTTDCQHTNGQLTRYQSHQVTAVCHDCERAWSGHAYVMPGWVQDVVHDYLMMMVLLYGDDLAKLRFHRRVVVKAQTQTSALLAAEQRRLPTPHNYTTHSILIWKK